MYNMKNSGTPNISSNRDISLNICKLTNKFFLLSHGNFAITIYKVKIYSCKFPMYCTA